MFGFFRSAPTPRPDPAEAVRAVAESRALLVDVREPDELRATGTARGAINLPLSRLAELADPASGLADARLTAARAAGLPVYAFCASGARSDQAAAILRRFGHAQVINLGNLAAWRAGGGAVVR